MVKNVKYYIVIPSKILEVFELIEKHYQKNVKHIMK